MASRRKVPNRSRARSQPTVAEAPPPPVTISIVTYPDSGKGGPSIQGDVDLVKASLLYADKVELISFGASMLGNVAALSAGGDDALMDLMLSFSDEEMGQMSGNGPLPANWRDMVNGMRVAARMGLGGDSPLTEVMEEFESGLKEATQQLQETAEEMLESSGATELVPCLESGLLVLSDAGLGDGSDFDAVMRRWTKIIDARLKDPRARLLFDDSSGDLVSSMLDEGHLKASELAMRHIGSAALGSGLVGRLPAFPQAPMDELLDLRKDLGAALSRYRRAVSRLAATLPSVVGTDLQAAVDDVWVDEVWPSIVEIDALLHDHGLVREIARNAGMDVRALIMESFAIYVGLAGPGGVGNLLSAGVSAGATGAQAVVTGAVKSIREKQSTRTNDLFYLYEANRRLAN